VVYVLMHVVAKERQLLEKNHPVADQKTGDLSGDFLALPAAIEIELENKLILSVIKSPPNYYS
jgi:hypothetical protein